MVLAMRAALEASPHPDPLALSTHFLRPPSFGPAIVEVEELRTGRNVATHRARLVEDGSPGPRRCSSRPADYRPANRDLDYR